MISRGNNKIEDAVKRQAVENGVLKVIVALSGGADSIATAFALKTANLELKALHCNFHLRAEESDRDCEFVKKFCHSNAIPLEIMDFDVDAYLMSHRGESIEMACRNLRYDWFDKVLSEESFDRIATGHNEDDNIETFFLNMLRGSGTRGLKAMVHDTGKIWRPLLSFNKEDILSYLQENNLSYVTDSTNLKTDFRRNYLRNIIIPEIKKEWKGFYVAMSKTISNIQEENNIIEHFINLKINQASSALEVSKILDFPGPLLLIKRFIDPAGPYVATPAEILSAIKAKKPHIRKWRLRKGDVILRNNILSIKMGHCK